MKYREPSLEMVHLPLANVDSSRGGMSIHALEGRQVVPVAVHNLDPAALAGDVEAVLRVDGQNKERHDIGRTISGSAHPPEEFPPRIELEDTLLLPVRDIDVTVRILDDGRDLAEEGLVLALVGAQHQIHDELQASGSLFDRPGRGNQDLPGEQHGDADHQLCGSYVACTLEHAGLLMAAVALTSAG
jgi:hypothetical protein